MNTIRISRHAEPGVSTLTYAGVVRWPNDDSVDVRCTCGFYDRTYAFAALRLAQHHSDSIHRGVRTRIVVASA